MRRFAVLLVCFFAALMPARADEKPLDSGTASKLMTYYYVNKDTTQVGPFLAWLESSHVTDNENIAIPVTAFVAGVFAENPDKVQGWVTSVAFTGTTKEVIERALWYAGRGDLIGDALHDRVDYAGDKPVSLLDMPLETPGSFDMMWGMFMATGNVAYPARLINVLDESVAFTGDAKVDAIYRGAAVWSLQSNAEQHDHAEGLSGGAVRPPPLPRLGLADCLF